MIEPSLPAHAMKTYGIVAPLRTHWRAATCAEIDCPNYLNGWRTIVDERTELGQGQAYYIRKQSDRRAMESRTEDGRTIFQFEAGQVCFRSSEHRARVDRQELFVVRDGDFRGNPRGTEARQHVRPADWVDDFAEHQQVLKDRLQEG